MTEFAKLCDNVVISYLGKTNSTVCYFNKNQEFKCELLKYATAFVSVYINRYLAQVGATCQFLV